MRDFLGALRRYNVILVIVACAFGTASPGYAQVPADGETEKPPGTAPSQPPQGSAQFEGPMTLDRMDKIIARLDDKAKSLRKGTWQFHVEKTPVIVITDEKNNRMRILVAIRPSADLPPELLQRLMQANFDTALDSRYAIAREILWAVHIHPLRALHDRQFISAIGQTVNLSLTFGTTFTSGELSYGGGDSRGIIQRQLIDKLLKKGVPI